jgi:hypothetical protein
MGERRTFCPSPDLFNKDLGEIELRDLPQWISQNPQEVGRIIGYRQAHHAQDEAKQEDPFEAFTEAAGRLFDRSQLMGAVYRYGIEQGHETSTQDLKLERSVRMITKAFKEMTAPNPSSKPRAKLSRTQ